MTRCSLLRSRLLFVALSVVATVLSGCLQGAPEVQDAHPVEVESTTLDALQYLPEGPLREALAPEPAPFLDAPTTVGEALRLWTDFPSLPLPEPSPIDPLGDALQRFAAAHGATVPTHDLPFTAQQETAVARVILAFLQAETLQQQAVADLTTDELAFLLGDPHAVEAWSLSTSEPDAEAYNQEARRLVDDIDIGKNLQAADLLARAVDELQAAFEDNSLSAPASHTPAQVPDADGDDTPDALETIAGTSSDPADEGAADDHAGSIPRGDLEDDGVLLRIASAGGVGPGLLITGEGNSLIDENPLLLIDLGGNDTYVAEGFGGAVSPVPQGINTPVPNEENQGGLLDARMTRLVVDLGGDDDYLPKPIAESVTRDFVIQPPRIVYAGALGGTVAGVSLLFDGAGDDEYRSEASIELFTQQDTSRDRTSTTVVYGPSHGGGVFGGVGALIDLDGADTHFARVHTEAVESLAGSINRPTADAYGITQGGGWLGGVGILLDQGNGNDSYVAETSASTPSHDLGAFAGSTAIASGQGASFSGAGIMVDEMGDAQVHSDQILSQGAALTKYDPQLIVKTAGSLTPGRTPVASTIPSIGFLFGSDGDTMYQATSYAQGAAQGAHGDGGVEGDPWILHYQDGARSIMRRDQTEAFYAPAIAMLIDRDGDDRYRLQQDIISQFQGDDLQLAQGSARLGSVAMLIDANGNDHYDAEAARSTQGSGWLAQGILLDQFGHDHYQADRQSQGYATDDPQTLFDSRFCAGNPTVVGGAHSYAWAFQVYCPEENLASGTFTHLKNEEYEDGTHQFTTMLRAQLPTVGALIDRHGIDRYEAAAESQGYAAGFLQHTAEAGACHASQLEAGPISVVYTDPDEYPLPPYLGVCDDRYPDYANNPGEWTTPDTSAPPTHTFVLGLLLDAGGHDAYLYGPDGDPKGGTPPLKTPADGSEPDDFEGNDWQWDQSHVPQRTVDDTRLPQNLDGGTGDVEDADADYGPKLNNPTVAGLTGIDEAIPRQGSAVYGRGIDDNSLEAGVGALIDVLPTDVVSLSLSAHPAEGNMTTITESGGVLWLRLDLSRNEAVALEHIDVLASGLLVTRLESTDLAAMTPGDPIWIPWDTTLLEDDEIRFPDGPYDLQASATTNLGAYGVASFESNLIDDFLVNNPPIIFVDVDADAISPALGDAATLSLTILPDSRFPSPPNETANGLTPEEQGRYNDTGAKPGATATVHYVARDGSTYPVRPLDYYPAGTYQFVLDGSCTPTLLDCPGDGVVPDGRHTLVVRTTDSDGNIALNDTHMMLVDGTFPRSSILLDPFSNGKEDEVSGSLRVPYSVEVDPRGIAVEDSAQVAPVADVTVYRTGDDGATWTKVGSGTAGFVLSSEPNTADGNPTFLSVATDALGNSESPCTEAELSSSSDDPVCVTRKLERLGLPVTSGGERDWEAIDPVHGPVDTIVDFIDPQVSDLSIDPEHGFVAPGTAPGVVGATDVVFRATVSDQGTGIDPSKVVVSIGGLKVPMTLEQTTEDGGIFVYDSWNEVNGGVSAQEEPFVYTVEVVDLAGNRADDADVGTLDLVAPRITLDDVQYRDSEDVLRGAGGPGITVELLFTISDGRYDQNSGVFADFSAVHDSLGLTKCGRDPNGATLDAVVCQVLLPAGEDGVQDGTYPVPVTATDVVGNVATVVADVLVNDQAVLIQDFHVSDVGPDSLTVSWTTDQPSTTRLYYGRTAAVDRASDRDLDQTLEHEVTITGLNPATSYFLVAASENLAGVESRSDALVQTTQGAIGVQFTDLEEGEVINGKRTVTLEVELSTPGDDVSVRLFSVRADGLGGRQRLDEQTASAGTVSFEVDTATLGDGASRLLAQVSRGRDVSEATSPTFVVDNTAPTLVPVRPLPGLELDAAAPVVDLLVFDANPDLSTLGITLDGAAVTPLDITRTGAGASLGLRITLDPMEPGERILGLSLSDVAGNKGTLPLEFVAGDEAAEDAATVDHHGRSASGPGATVTFVYDAATPLSAVAVDTAPLAPGLLELTGGAFWTADWTLPDDVQDGTYLLDVVTTDLQDQTLRIVGIMELRVDGTPPEATVTAVASGPTVANVTVDANEPVTVRVLRGNELLEQETQPALQHALSLKGLQSGSKVDLDIVVVDDAGRQNTFARALLMPDDTTDPSGVTELKAVVNGGNVFLTWQPASDDGVVSGYLVERHDGASWRVNTPTTVDRSAPGGNATYTVRALDDAGNQGTPEEVTVAIPGHLRLVDSLVTPATGDTNTHFLIRVSIEHNLPDAPDVSLQVPGRTVTLEPENATADCHDGCWYTARTTLPATRFGADALSLHATAEDASADASLPPSKVTVTQAPENVESPGPLPVLALLGALLVARRWRK